MPPSQIAQFEANSKAASAVIGAKAAGYNVIGDPRPAVTAYVAQHQLNEGTFPSLAVLVADIARQVSDYGSIARMPADKVGNTRNDMYLVSEAIRLPILPRARSARSMPTRARSTTRPNSFPAG
jgi:PiT family inorganic phosphate transporter